MPSSAFAHLTDAETADLVAYLKSLGPAGRRQPHVKVGPVGRLGILAGKFRSEAAMIRAHENPPLPDLGPQFAQGRSLARACVECHGPALKGSSDLLKTPDLMIAAAYEPEDFAKLMKTGIAAGGRQVGLMSAAARIRFQAFTPQEVSALYAYLKERADRQIADASAATLPRR
jgi:mono/diheme cytochrome c family protein